MPYIIRDKDSNPVGILAYPPTNGPVEYVKDGHADIQAYYDWKEARAQAVTDRLALIESEWKNVAIQKLKSE